jgi:5-bromo-4-chloroindolyl phosphate hydrolysis protein
MAHLQTPAERAEATWRAFGSFGATLILYLLPTPLLFKAGYELWFGGRFVGFIACLGLYVLFIFGASLARRGIAREIEFSRSKIALASGPPLKLLGGSLIALATGLTGWLAAGLPFFTSIAIGLGALLGFYLAFGFDIRGEKGVAPGAGFTTAEVAEALREARAKLASIEQGARRLSGAGAFLLRQKLRAVVAAAQKVLALIEEDPRDLRRARKFLNVYLDGAKSVTENYASTSARSHTPEMEARFSALLDDLEKTFTEQHQKLLENDTLDLDAQIEVLKTRLTREGLS